MALSVNELNTVSRRLFDKKIVSSVYDNSYFFKKLLVNGKIKKKGGVQIQFPIRYKELGQSSSVGWSEVIDFTKTETRTSGVLEWAPIVGQTLMQWDESVYNQGKQRIVDLLADKSQELTEDMQEALSDALWNDPASAVGTYVMVPIPWIIDATNTYAGVAVADAATWLSGEDSAETALKLYGANSLSEYVNAATLGANKPTDIITTRNLFSKAQSLIQAQQRYSKDDAGDMGFTTITFNGIPIVADSHCPANNLLGLDMSCIECHVTDTNGKNGIQLEDWFSLEQVGRPWDVAKAAKWVGNIVVRRRNTSFKMTALDPEV